jgi:hypothetical protein
MNEPKDTLLHISALLENTFNPCSKDGTWSIKHSINGNVLTLKYSTIMQYNEDYTLRLQVEKEREMAIQLIKEAVDQLKKDFKIKTGNSCKLQPGQGQDDIEVIQANAQLARKVAYYRYNLSFTVE